MPVYYKVYTQEVNKYMTRGIVPHQPFSWFHDSDRKTVSFTEIASPIMQIDQLA